MTQTLTNQRFMLQRGNWGKSVGYYEEFGIAEWIK